MISPVPFASAGLGDRYKSILQILRGGRMGIPMRPPSPEIQPIPPAFGPAQLSPIPPATGPARPSPLTTKDDIEPSRQGGRAGEIMGAIPSALSSLPTIDNPPPSSIQFARPGEGLHEYAQLSPGFPDAYAGEGGFLGAQGTPGGGAFTPSQPWEKTGMSPGQLASFPSYQEDMQASLAQAETQARLAALRKMAEDPMWEERERARLWTESQIGIQKGIRESLQEEYSQRLLDVTKRVKAAMPNASPEEIQKEVERQMMNEDITQDVRTPTSYGMPSSVFTGRGRM